LFSLTVTAVVAAGALGPDYAAGRGRTQGADTTKTQPAPASLAPQTQLATTPAAQTTQVQESQSQATQPATPPQAPQTQPATPPQAPQTQLATATQATQAPQTQPATTPAAQTTQATPTPAPQAKQATITFKGDSVIYASDAYRFKRVGDFDLITVLDTLNSPESEADSLFALDSLPKLTARDTIFPPDSLKEIDPFRYEYYVALLDPEIHRLVVDSLQASHDTLFAHELFDLAQADSLLRIRIDSTYYADSTVRAQIAFELWYNSLDKQARKAYDYEKKVERKMAQADSIRAAKEQQQAIKDSLLQVTPRILQTPYFPEEMQYKRIVAWEVDQDFHSIKPFEPDTSFNYHFYDYPIYRKDVNATWLGVGGSPAQSYNFFERRYREDVEFYKTSEVWSYNPSTFLQYNTKTPHTELAYFGTLLAGEQKESDNLHIFTTQNITPELNISFLYETHGGNGILENEKTSNKTTGVGINYVGKKYLMNAGVINNKINRNENGGVQDNYFVRDTSGIDTREFPVNLKSASTQTKKTTFYLDQQYRIAFDFLSRKDTTQVETDSLATPSFTRDVTSAFIGHSTEITSYSRIYQDKTTGNLSAFYNDVFNFNPDESRDSMGVKKLDNKVFIRLQPWAQDAIVSKLNIGVGNLIRTYFDSTSLRPTSHKESDIYTYAGIEGKFRNNLDWNAKGHLNLIGDNIGDFDLEGNLDLRFYPFRRAKNSPLNVNAHFETSLKEPNYYQKRINTNHFSWDNDFSKISTTKIEGKISIPRWKFDASVGYALLSNNIYYDTKGIIRQNDQAMNVLSAYVHKDFVLFNHIHLDNRILAQSSSNQDVLPLPKLALNLRYYVQMNISKGAMIMQLGANAFYNTQWYAQSYNPVLGVFHNQTERLYENGPYIDLFANMQWKRACLFIKYQNFMNGWPMKKKDYFSADHYIVTTDGMTGLKIGIFWPFYTEPGKAPINK